MLKDVKQNRNVTNVTSTPYDDVFRTLVNDCRRRLVIPLVNEIFKESYSGKEEISPAPNEHFMNRQDGKEAERITDSSFTIYGKTPKKYHIECQSRPDGSMLVRMFEYDTQIAVDDAQVEKYHMKVTFPRSAVLFLRHDRNTPSQMTVSIEAGGKSLSYGIPIVLLQNYTLEEIFTKDLLFFIPFYIFLYEKEFTELEQQEVKLEKLEAEYKSIRARLDKMCEEGLLTELDKRTIIDMSQKVLDSIAVKYPTIKEGVHEAMGGKVLEYEAKTIYRNGIAQGISEGIEQIALNMINNGSTDEFIQKVTNLSMERIAELRAKLEKN